MVTDDNPFICIKGLSAPRMLIALYDYNAREISDMSFRKGDRMELLDDRCVLGNILNNIVFNLFLHSKKK